MRTTAMCIALLSLGALNYTCASPLDAYRAGENTIRPIAVKLARDAVRAQVAGRCLTMPSRLPEVFRTRAAVFVTIAKNGRRRGCKGVFEPVTDNLAAEIVRAAVGAATADIRYRPIRRNELDQLTFTVSIVGPLKRVEDTNACSPGDHGLLLRSGDTSGVILPGEAKTSAWGLAEAKRQAGIRSGEPYELYVFETLALHETTGAPSKRRK